MQTAERVESGKSAAVAAAGGFLGILPTTVTASSGAVAQALSVATGLATCALFGVVYRYIVASDEKNPQLKGGAVAAFGLTRGLPLAQGALTSAESIDLEVLAAAGLLAGQSMLLFGFAAAAMELAFKGGVVQRLGQVQASDTAA